MTFREAWLAGYDIDECVDIAYGVEPEVVLTSEDYRVIRLIKLILGL